MKHYVCSDEEEAYLQGKIDATNEAIALLRRGPWWHFRDLVARGLHWIAIRIAPKTEVTQINGVAE